jgi:hypothetical protein
MVFIDQLPPHRNHPLLMKTPPQVDHLDVVGRHTPSLNGNQEFTTPRSLMSQAGPSRWDVCS